MEFLPIRNILPIVILFIVMCFWCETASGQFGELRDLRQRLIEHTDEEYVAARTEALGLPKGAFQDLLFLLRLSPEYSLEQILALILEAHINHPEIASRFYDDLRHMLENPENGMTRSGEPRYRWWPHWETKEAHPFVFEAYLKMELPRLQVRQMLLPRASGPNIDNVPFILHLSIHRGFGHIIRILEATEGIPEERERLRPIIADLYMNIRQRGKASTPSIIVLYERFGTLADLDILRSIRDFEYEQLQIDGYAPWDDDDTTMADHTAAIIAEREARKALAAAVRDGQPAHEADKLSAAVNEAKANIEVARRRMHVKYRWDQLEASIARMEANLQE